MEDNYVKVHGKITNFNGTPLENAEVRLMDNNFEDLYLTYTDNNGMYEIRAKNGLYYAFYACKDYKINYLEYWAWNVPIFRDMELNAQIDGLEVYSLIAFQVKGTISQLMLYFRPMSLKKAKELQEQGLFDLKEKMLRDSVKIIDISPNLMRDDIEVEINEGKVEVYEVNKVLEYGGNGQSLYAYLIHVGLNKDSNKYDYNKINVLLKDRETGEKGQGGVFWKEEQICYCKEK